MDQEVRESKNSSPVADRTQSQSISAQPVPLAASISPPDMIQSVLPPKVEDFLLKEYEALRKEIEQKIAAIESTARAGVIASAAIWSWLLINQQVPGSRLIVFIPPTLSLLLALKFIRLNAAIFTIAGYVEKIESAFQLPRGLGWETYLRGRRNLVTRSSEWINDQTFLGNWDKIFWFVLCGVNIAVAIVLWLSPLDRT